MLQGGIGDWYSTARIAWTKHPSSLWCYGTGDRGVYYLNIEKQVVYDAKYELDKEGLERCASCKKIQGF